MIAYLFLGIALGCYLPTSATGAASLVACAAIFGIARWIERPTPRTSAVLGRDYRVPRGAGLPTAYHRKR